MIPRLAGREELSRWRRRLPAGATLGFVPTMGGLHAGHAALIEQAARECAEVLVSVFVNPIQFDEQADFERYPRDPDGDCALIQAHGGGAVYLPPVEDVYPEGAGTRVVPGAAGRRYEGAHRPGHFAGVLTVVAKLLLRVRPDRAYFGEKDAQQLHLVRGMAADLDVPVRIVGCPTVREEDGLAFSSRNRRLAPADRKRATVLYRALTASKKSFRGGERSPAALEEAMQRVFAEAGIEPDYAAVVDERDFLPARAADPGLWRAVTAARVGGVRLLDNLLLGRA